MAVIKTGIERNSFDYARAFAEAQTTNATMIKELTDAYVLIARNMGISVYDFLQRLKASGDSRQQALFLAAQLNNIRVGSALLGLSPSLSVPTFISREIAI